MMDQPSILEIVEVVRAFLEQRAMPELKGHTAFHARVSANALGIVARQLRDGETAAAYEKMGLIKLLGHDGDLEALNRELCLKIRSGAIDLETPGFKEHLATTTRDKVKIDQPTYGGLRVYEAGGGSQ
jgi:hypothetical protein